MNYDFKALPELGWAALIGAGIFVVEMLTKFDLEAVMTDPWTWVIALVGGSVRAGAAALLIAIRKRTA